MPETTRRPTWVRAGDRYQDLKGVPDDFITMDAIDFRLADEVIE